MSDKTITLAYFSPSAEGRDYTDGFISSDYDISIEYFETVQEAALYISTKNAKIYDDGTLNRPSHYYLNTPECSYTLLIDGIDQGSNDSLDIEQMFEEFNRVYKLNYANLVEGYKQTKKEKEEALKRSVAEASEAKRRAQYETLRKEFDKQ